MGAKISSFAGALYDSKKKQFLGRDGAGWGKLGVFYFFFYLGLAGFFCAMLAVFMALSPKDRPRYYSESSRMVTRSNPLSPGLGFRPQPEVDKNIIVVSKDISHAGVNRSVQSLDQYLKYYYPQNTTKQQRQDQAGARGNGRKFTIRNPGDCTPENDFGFRNAQPCVLVKMNKIVGFKPIAGSAPDEVEDYKKRCGNRNTPDIAVYCYGEYPADADNVGDIRYISESGTTRDCGSLNSKRFPYHGKKGREDVYQAPYVWVQFLNPKPNILINVLCRVYGENIDFDRKTARALTRFQIFVDSPPPPKPDL